MNNEVLMQFVAGKYADIREFARAVCTEFTHLFSSTIICERGYPEESVHALTKAGGVGLT